MHSQATFTSVQSGDYTDPATWGTATAPTSIDHVVISTGNIVVLDDILTAHNVTISGSLESTADAVEFTVTGNLTVNLGGLFKGIYYYDAGSFGYDKGIQLTVAGNIINNGRIDLSDGASYLPEGVLKLNGTTVQTVSGLGTFGGTIFSTDNTNRGGVINQFIVDNSSTSTPNIVWGFNNTRIRSVLTFTNARVDLGTNKMAIGNYGSATISCAAGSGFLSGTIGKWYGAYDNFAAITPGSDYNSANALYPFISADGKSRAAFISRPNDTTNSAVSGELSISYYDASSVSPGFSIADGAYTVTDVYEGAWVIEKDATYSFPLGNHSIAFSIEGAYLIKNGNSRIIKTDETTVGNHQSGTTTPFAQRIGLSDTDLANAFLVGYNAVLDTPVTSTQTGNWNDASTWSSNSVPSCTDTVTILSGHTITVNSTCSAAGVNINPGATLVSDSSGLTVGCTNNNATFFNKGTYTINGGSLIVNGNVVHADGSTFAQTGGDIIVDGNHNGDAATSIDQTLFKIGESALNLSGGKITIVDPPVVTATLATTHTATTIVPCTGFFCWFPTDIMMDSTDDLAIGQIVVGAGVPAGTTIAAINPGVSINTNPSLPATGLTLPLNLSFYTVGTAVSAFIYESANNYAAAAGHTLQIGDGISTEKSAVTANGFNCIFKAADGALSLNNLTVNALDSTNRFVNLDGSNPNFLNIMNVQNDFTIMQGKVIGAGVDTYYGGNVVNNGQLNLYNSTYLGNYIDGDFVATSNPQTISGTGSFNAQVDVILNNPFNTASVSQLRVNNTSPAGVTFAVPFNVANGLNMVAGIIHTSASSVLTVGTPAMAYTGSINGNFGPDCYIDGPVSKDISGGQNAANLNNGTGFDSAFFFPVGKSTYAPIWVAITTPSGGFETPGAKLKVEAFETNTGTPSANIAHLSQNRWEVSKIAGDASDFNIRVGDATVDENYIIVQAASAAGVYDNDFGITATFEAGTPNTLTSMTAPLPWPALKGFFSTARQAECSVVAPGNTLASETLICGGKSVTLSLQNIIVGEGISYQWQSSATGSGYTDIATADAKTYNATPLENTYYRCNVTCSFSSTTVASTPVLIALNNTITATTPATICLDTANTATLSAASADTVKWYDAQTGGNVLGTGTSFTTPILTETTTFYAGTESTTNGVAGMVYTQDGSGSGSFKGLAFNLSNAIILNSVQVYPQQNPGGSGAAPITVTVFQNGVAVPGTTAVTFTPDTFSGWSPTNTAQTVVLNYQLAAGDGYSLEITDGASYDNALATSYLWPNPYPITTGAVSILGGISGGFIDESYYNYFYNWDVTEVCSSARVPVVATVDCDLANPASAFLRSVAAYPNPYSGTFKLKVITNSSSDIQVKVYDMLGRLIEQQESSSEQISQMEMGNSYPSGIYNVVVTQENNAKSLRVIKE
ncbi:MAG: T9SS type A sorting domain-containing protein [Flavobacterium sp. JAD_PAG50586_2]|nr:MAG: T9SS type A sorting domain-containing protein [Flavobacterium sp. JAD_PAG50586_2]